MTARRTPGRRAPSRSGARAPAPERPGLAPAEGRPLDLDLEALGRFFGAGPAWADPAAARYRFRVDAPAGGWLELFVAPKERLVSLRMADGAVTSIHVDITLEAVEGVGVGERGGDEPWLEVVCGQGPAASPCRVSITLRPDILVVLDYGRR